MRAREYKTSAPGRLEIQRIPPLVKNLIYFCHSNGNSPKSMQLLVKYHTSTMFTAALLKCDQFFFERANQHTFGVGIIALKILAICDPR